MENVMQQYSELFKKEFTNAIDHHYLKVTPFTFPKVDPNRELTFVDKAQTRHLMDVQDHSDFLNFMPGIVPSNGEIVPYVENRVKKLAQRAAGAYSVYCRLATEEFGKGCGVSHNMRFGVIFNTEPSIADPAGQLPGWVYFRFQFVACPHEWLAYAVQVIE